MDCTSEFGLDYLPLLHYRLSGCSSNRRVPGPLVDEERVHSVSSGDLFGSRMFLWGSAPAARFALLSQRDGRSRLVSDRALVCRGVSSPTADSATLQETRRFRVSSEPAADSVLHGPIPQLSNPR